MDTAGAVFVGFMLGFVACGGVQVLFWMLAHSSRGLDPITFFEIDDEWHAEGSDGRRFRKVGINWFEFPGGEFACMNDALDTRLAKHKRVEKWLRDEPERVPHERWLKTWTVGR